VLIDAFRGKLDDASVGAGSLPLGLLAGVSSADRLYRTQFRRKKRRSP